MITRDEDDITKYWREVDKYSYLCPCGRKVFIRNNQVRSICSWCGRYVYKNKQDEFKAKMQEKLKKR